MYTVRIVSPVLNSFKSTFCSKLICPSVHPQIMLSNHRSFLNVQSSQKQVCAKKSGIGETGVLVYEAPLKTRVKVVKFLSLSSSMLGFSFLPIVVKDLCQISVIMGCAAGAVSSIFLSTPFMLHWITKRYVLELHYDTLTQEFTAKTYNLVNQIKEIKFKAADVTVPEIPGMLSSFYVKDLPLFVDSTLVNDPDAYSHMMGYDKPLNLELNSDKECNKES